MSRPRADKHPRQMRKPVSRTPVWAVPAAVVAGVALLVAAFLVIRWYTTPVAPPPLKPGSRWPRQGNRRRATVRRIGAAKRFCWRCKASA